MAQKTVQTIADIARLAGVSTATVSRALNNSPLLSAKTRERVQAIAREHKFQSNVSARRLRNKSSRTIAFPTRGDLGDLSFNNLFILDLIGSISSALAEAEYDLLMIQVNSRNNDEWIAEYLNTGRVDGYILITTPPGSIQANTMLELGAPFAAWGAPLPGRNFCSVIGDNFTGGKLAAEHLIRSGRRKLAFLGGPANSPEIQDRYAGFETGLTQAGWPFEQRRIAYGDYSNRSGAAAMRQLLERDPELDAVFVNSDLMATAAIAVLQESGRAVPGDVAVIGYDDLSIARLTTPPLTTISQNLPLAGKMLAQNLVQYLQTGQITSTVLPVELIVRKSG